MPHCLEHSDQGDQEPTLQLRAQTCFWHELISVKYSQPAPPNFGGLIMARDRDLWPGPHGASHGVHAVQLPVTHATGHGLTLHFLLSVRAGHFLPPAPGAETTARARSFVPGPQAAEHGVQDDHMETSQLVAHTFFEHERDSVRMSQSLPPFLGC